MNCHSVRGWLSAHLDERLPEAEREHLLLHLDECRECSLVFEQMLRVQDAMRRLPALTPPPHLASMLRVMASRERVRRLVLRSPAAVLASLAARARLWVDNLMRPVAVPLAGGLISAIILFSMLVPSILFHRSLTDDVPLAALYREAAVTTPAPFGFEGDDFILEVTVDQKGRMVDYSITDGERLIHNPRLRRAVENYMLFTRFSPATAFGQPTLGKVTVSFSRYQFNVGS